MKTLLRLLAAGALAGCTILYAQTQNFSGSDDFTNITPYWGLESASGGGSFTVTGGVLKFQDTLTESGHTSMAGRNWTLNAGSYIADWQVQVDVTLNVTDQVAGQLTYWALLLSSSENPYNAAEITFQQIYATPPMPPMRLLNSRFFYSDGEITMPNPAVASTDTITMRASFLSASHTITLDYDAGSGFSTLLSASVETWLGWGMGPTDTFNLTLSAYNVTNAGPTLSLTSGVYADNFIASPFAVPEPSAYAACTGLVALGLALVRRHRMARR